MGNLSADPHLSTGQAERPAGHQEELLRTRRELQGLLQVGLCVGMVDMPAKAPFWPEVCILFPAPLGLGALPTQPPFWEFWRGHFELVHMSELSIKCLMSLDHCYTQ